MIPIVSLPAKIIKLLEANVSPSEIAAGVVLGMFMGFVPLNGPITILLLIFFLTFKLNRISTILTLPLFKLFYVMGIYHITDLLGGMLLIQASFLKGFWEFLTDLPVVAFLGLNNTLVTGGIILSAIFTWPVFQVSRVAARKIQGVYGEKIKKLPFVKWIRNLPIVQKTAAFISKLRRL